MFFHMVLTLLLITIKCSFRGVLYHFLGVGKRLPGRKPETILALCLAEKAAFLTTHQGSRRHTLLVASQA